MSGDTDKRARLPGASRLDYGAADQRLMGALERLDASGVAELRAAIDRSSARLGLDYVRESGETILIPINPMPASFTARQVRYLSGALRTLAQAVARTVARRLDDAALGELLQLGDAELDWLRLSKTAPGRPAARVFHRWDLALDIANDPGAMRCRLFEVNSVDVGGVHYAAAAREVLLESLRAIGVRGLSLDATGAGRDSRLLLLSELKRHARALGRRPGLVAIAENQDFTTGITEAASLARFFSERGLPTECVDVRAFECDPGGAVHVHGRPVDVIYRNIELRDLAELESAGADLAGLRAGVAAGLVFSSPFGELDHKSLWEVLGDPAHARWFSPEERRVIARHIPWTRLLDARRTTDPAGRSVDLPEYTRRQRRRLVMKPNRSCGGQGVTIGAMVGQEAWDRVLAAALAAPRSWVVQELIPIPRRRTVRLNSAGRLMPDIVYAVYGLFSGPAGIAVVGRSSHSPVVNVMQGGGMLGILGRGRS